jgi:hypothetical protein
MIEATEILKWLEENIQVLHTTIKLGQAGPGVLHDNGIRSAAFEEVRDMIEQRINEELVKMHRAMRPGGK